MPRAFSDRAVTEGNREICNNYRAPKGVDLERGWHVQIQGDWNWKLDVYPGDSVPIIRRAEGGGRECVMARFGLVPWWSKTEKVGWSTTNARSETAAEKPAFRDAFARQQYAVIPAWEIFEPFYAPGAKRSVRWGIERVDGTALGICGLWDRWRSPSGELVVSFAMLTINCDEHPLLKRFHKHFDEKGEPNERRTPALLREEDYDRWLDASVADAPGFFNTFGSDDLQAHASPAIPARPKAGPSSDQRKEPLQRELL